MSGFANPNSPFADPFSDPAVAQVTSSSGDASGLDDYNPFANQPSNKSASVRGASNPPSGPAVLDTNQSESVRSNAAPAYTPTSAQSITQADLLRKQEELERKAAELAAREEALRTGQANLREPNWPPVPSFCPFGPCIYQDINVEIPIEFQRIVRLAYYLWMYFFGVLVANFLGGIARWTAENKADSFGFSLMCLLILTPGSFLCWYRPLYKAFRNDSSFNFMVFFFVFFCQLVMAIIWAIGIPGSGAWLVSDFPDTYLIVCHSGLIVAIETIGQGVFYSLFMFLVSFVLISYAGCSFLVLVKVHSIYRSTGASIEKARAEFASGVMRNEHVQQVAAGAARSAMSQAFTSGNTNNSSGLRY